MSLRKASSEGRLAALRELRHVLATAIDECESMRDLAALTNRFQSVLAEIDDLKPGEQKGDAVDEIAKRRAARRAGATPDSARSTRSG